MAPQWAKGGNLGSFKVATNEFSKLSEIPAEYERAVLAILNNGIWIGRASATVTDQVEVEIGFAKGKDEKMEAALERTQREALNVVGDVVENTEFDFADMLKAYQDKMGEDPADETSLSDEELLKVKGLVEMGFPRDKAVVNIKSLRPKA